jgi:hypothetical protein
VFTLKVVTYCATFGAALFFGFWELKLKRQLTDDAPQPPVTVSDMGVINDLKEQMRREQYLRSLPKQALFRYRRAVVLKFLFMAILIAEVIFLQK